MFHLNRIGLPFAGALGVVLALGCDKDSERTAEPMEEARQEARETPGADTLSPTPVNPPTTQAAKAEAATKERAEAELKAADGQKIEGEVEFFASDKGVRIVAELEDAPPGKHGLHVHEKGDCSDIEGKSMGSHFAPEGHQHALPGEAAERHLGDLGNVEINDKGDGRLEITLEKANLKANDPMSLLGKAVVVHSGEDLGKSKQPSGSSGAPIACGVIEKT